MIVNALANRPTVCIAVLSKTTHYPLVVLFPALQITFALFSGPSVLGMVLTRYIIFNVDRQGERNWNIRKHDSQWVMIAVLYAVVAENGLPH